METLVLVLHVIACVILIVLVLLQSGKEGMGVIFGGGSSSVFGSTGAGGILAKLTTFLAIIFLLTSLGYNIMTSKKDATESQILHISIEDQDNAATPPPVDSNKITIEDQPVPGPSQGASGSENSGSAPAGQAPQPAPGTNSQSTQ